MQHAVPLRHVRPRLALLRAVDATAVLPLAATTAAVTAAPLRAVVAIVVVAVAAAVHRRAVLPPAVPRRTADAPLPAADAATD